MSNEAQMREQFEKANPEYDFTRSKTGNYEQTHVRKAYSNWQVAYQAALSSLPRMTEEELRELRKIRREMLELATIKNGPLGYQVNQLGKRMDAVIGAMMPDVRVDHDKIDKTAKSIAEWEMQERANAKLPHIVKDQPNDK